MGACADLGADLPCARNLVNLLDDLEMTPALILLLIWIACGVAAYGFTVADFQRSFPALAAESLAADRWLGVFLGLLGPASLVAIFFATAITTGRPFKHGWKL